MPTVIINGEELELADGERLNAIQAAQRVGEQIPHYCWHPGLTVVASCRMCLIETGRRDPQSGEISMVPKLVPGCQTPTTDGTVIVTNSDKVKAARAMVEEDLLIRHPIDCPICDKAGECSLQDYHFEHGQSERRADIKPFTSRRRPMGDTVTLFVDRCVMCTRCVRFTREITGSSELMVVNRGAHEEIDVFPGYPLDNKMSGNVVDLCPVGALGDKDFLYQQRVWFMNSHDGVCAGCSTGCSIKIEQNQDRIYRLKPRTNPHVNEWWMCDEGRYGFKHVHDAGRLTSARRVNAEGHYENLEWSELFESLDRALRRTGRLAAVVSPHLTVEEAYLLCQYLRSLDPEALVALGPVPVVGEHETFPNGFTIHAEKAPNRKGVEAVISGVTGRLLRMDELPGELKAEQVRGLWIAGGYNKSDWVTPAVRAAIDAVQTLVVQDLFTSPAMEIATFQLPGVAFAERAGSYVNFAERLQSFDWAVRQPAGVMSEGQVFSRLLGEEGLYSAPKVLAEVAGELGYFSAATGPIPAVGIDLRVNQMVGA